ncbi:MAG: hypothetical protein LBL97_00810 [Prevotellaceae bacterium]|jgi:hypothetical protein|nr:hypothetical protein [Prevotellaceae bacterium]
MSHQRLQHIFAAGRYSLPVTIFLALVCWIVAFMLLPDRPSGGESLAGLLLYAATGYLLILLNNAFALIRIRMSVQTMVYFLLVAACPVLHRSIPEAMAAALYLPALFMLLYSYQNKHTAEQACYTFMLLSAGSLFYPRLMLFMPLFWVGQYMFQSLTAKTFVAGCVGWLLPYWFLLAYAYLTGDMSRFTEPFGELVTFQPVTERGFLPWEGATLLFLFVLFVVSSIHSLTNGFQDKMRIHVYLQFFVLTTLFFFIYVLLQPAQALPMLPFLLINVSVLTGHFVAQSDSRSSNCFVVAVLLLLFSLFAFNLWTLL